MFDEHNFVKLGKNGAKKLQKSLWFEYCKKVMFRNEGDNMMPLERGSLRVTALIHKKMDFLRMKETMRLCITDKVSRNTHFMDFAWQKYCHVHVIFFFVSIILLFSFVLNNINT